VPSRSALLLLRRDRPLPQGRIPYLPKVSPMSAEMAVACAMSASPSEVFFARILSIPRPYKDQASRGVILYVTLEQCGSRSFLFPPYAGEAVRRVAAQDCAQEAATLFHRSLDLARRQNALSWELRTATSLARLWRDQHPKAKAITELFAADTRATANETSHHEPDYARPTTFLRGRLQSCGRRTALGPCRLACW
jgi:hypothetical protein